MGRVPVFVAGSRRAVVLRKTELRGPTTGTCRSAVSPRGPAGGSWRPQAAMPVIAV